MCILEQCLFDRWKCLCCFKFQKWRRVLFELSPDFDVEQLFTFFHFEEIRCFRMINHGVSVLFRDWK